MNAGVVRFLADPLRLRPRPAEPPAANSRDRAAPARAALALRVLTGPHAGAQVPVRHHRVLVGNLETECDVVLDVGLPAPHACLVRASHDGWTVLSVSGHLWVRETWVPPQQAHALYSGDVLTLGDTSFCLADSRSIDWDTVRVPERRQPPGQPAKAGARGVEQRAWARALQRFRPARASQRPAAAPGRAPLPARDRFLLAGLVAFGLLLLAAAGMLIGTAAPARPVPAVAAAPAEQARAALAGLEGTAELRVAADAAVPSRVVLAGYLPRAGVADQVAAVLAERRIAFDRRWVLVDALQRDLAARLGRREDAARLRYAGQGGFTLDAAPAAADLLDGPVRQAFADLPALQALTLDVRTAGPAAPAAVPVRYSRGAGGAVVVAGLDRLRGPATAPLPAVREVRLGAMPSVVLEDGSRYFQGAVLPGGAVLTRIAADQIEVQADTQTRRLPVRRPEAPPA